METSTPVHRGALVDDDVARHRVATWDQGQNFDSVESENSSVMNDNTLVSVHCYAGDMRQVTMLLPHYRHHGCPVVIVSPTDSPVNVSGVECRQSGLVGYIGQVSLDRQREHLKLLAAYPQEWFLAHDSDSVCISPELPRYLYENPEIVWSNEVHDWRTHPTPYPKIAMQPPYFFHRSTLLRMLEVPRDKALAHPITPFIDYYMLQLTEEAGIKHKSFPDGCSWGTSDAHGANVMVDSVQNRGKIFLHSIKTNHVLSQCVSNYRRVQRNNRGRQTFNPSTRLFEFRGSR